MYQQWDVHGSPIVAPIYSIYRVDFFRLGYVAHDHCYYQWIEEEKLQNTVSLWVVESFVEVIRIFKSIAFPYSVGILSVIDIIVVSWIVMKMRAKSKAFVQLRFILSSFSRKEFSL